ncbi:MAG TPA: UDP-N-acetylmuramate dehydrogenase [Gammaproteobacteria bacterium]|nr:UDP-N-acetylmuramate dehydrogenase [Gammaproteobacteria bacterium]
MAARFSSPYDIRRQVLLAGHTTWAVGGPVRELFTPASEGELAAFWQARRPDPADVLWLGLGSNLLVRDGGLRGLAIATHPALGGVEFQPQGRVWLGAGTPCAKVARQTRRRGLTGAKFLAGIPGTIGGALAMNAGAFGGEIWPLVRRVRVLDAAGRIHERRREDYTAGYRELRGPAGDAGFLAAQLQLAPLTDEVDDPIRPLLARRAATQPLGERSCGSVFRNPPGDHAARLIEAAGLKGAAVGEAVVSPKHANFIINRGAASALDIERLIGQVRATVAAHAGVVLRPEVRVVGEFA